MTTFKLSANTAFVCLLFCFQALCQPQPRVFYVAPTGDDSWSGTMAASNRNLTDGPFATLVRVRD